jgi:PPP family 3-phenylpropionic acid transporter
MGGVISRMPEARGWLTPELRTTIYYFTLFTTGGAITAYAGIWFAGQGLDAGQIGLIGSVPVFVMLVLNLVAAASPTAPATGGKRS